MFIAGHFQECGGGVVPSAADFPNAQLNRDLRSYLLTYYMYLVDAYFG
jgi:hypothetical protein